jgi:hypothetical protein
MDHQHRGTSGARELLALRQEPAHAFRVILFAGQPGAHRVDHDNAHVRHVPDLPQRFIEAAHRPRQG